METRAHYLLVGTCVILSVVILVAIVMFSAKSTSTGGGAQYRVNFAEGVHGLSVGNVVLFNGVRVGQVVRIKLDPTDPSLVRVLINVATDTPVRKDSEARIEMQGITGMTNIYISGGSSNSPLIVATEDEIPEIRAIKSDIEQFFSEIPKLLNSAQSTMEGFSNILTEENQKNIQLILKNFAELSAKLNASSSELQNVVVLVSDLSTLVQDTRKVIRQASTKTLKSADSALLQIQHSFRAFQKILDDVQSNIVSGTDGASQNFGLLLQESRALIRDMYLLVNKMTDNPQRFLLGDPVPK